MASFFGAGGQGRAGTGTGRWALQRRWTIAGGVAVVGLVGMLVLWPRETVGTQEFRLVFDGAEAGVYPNGLPFAPEEVIAQPVLEQVYRDLGVARRGDFASFRSSFFVYGSNEQFEELRGEMEDQLDNTRLSQADRVKMTEDFLRRLETLASAPNYTLAFRRSPGLASLSRADIRQILGTTLQVWSRQAKEQKGVERYDVVIFTALMLQREVLEATDPFVAADLLRTKMNRLIRALDVLARLPGGQNLRSGPSRLSLRELRARLEDTLRVRVQPLVMLAGAPGYVRDRRALEAYLRTRLWQVQLEEERMRSRVTSLRQALQDYITPAAEMPSPGSTPGPVALQSPGLSGSDTPAIMPQFGESFIDRLIELSRRGAELEYRQALTNRVIAAEEQVAALANETRFYGDALATFNGSLTARLPVDRPAFDRSFTETLHGVATTIEDVNRAYLEISKRNLGSSEPLFITPHPPRVRRELGLNFVQVLALIPLVLAGFALARLARWIRPGTTG